MKRHLFTLLTAISLLLCVTMAVIWVRSYLRMDRWQALQLRNESNTTSVQLRQLDINSTRGHIEFVILWGISRRATADKFDAWHTSYEPDWMQLHQSWFSHTGWTFYGSSGVGKPIGGGEEIALKFPDWLLTGLLSLFPLLWLQRCVFRAKPQGYCPTCGYDLRATPDRCPECGRIPAARLGAKP